MSEQAQTVKIAKIPADGADREVVEAGQWVPGARCRRHRRHRRGHRHHHRGAARRRGHLLIGAGAPAAVVPRSLSSRPAVPGFPAVLSARSVYAERSWFQPAVRVSVAADRPVRHGHQPNKFILDSRQNEADIACQALPSANYSACRG